jgi:hypothetical protein
VKRVALLLALAACGHPHGAAGDDDGPGLDASGGGDTGGSGDSGSGDGGTGDGGLDGGPGPIPLMACGASVEIDPALPVAWSFDSLASDIPAPWLLTGSTARLFYDTTSQVMTAAHGTATTAVWSSSLAGATFISSQRSASGAEGVTFQVSYQPMFARVTQGTFGPPIAIPCDPNTFLPGCNVRIAGDGHLWVRSDQHLFEQTANGFEDRGGAPVYPTLFDVDAAGDVWIGAQTYTDEVFQIWTLPHGGAGWVKTGSLTKTRLGAAATSIEGGFQLDQVVGAFAPDGSIHLWSSARCIYPGYHNKTQLYMRSRDGQTWDVETLPDIGTFTDGQVTWRDEAAWASDYDNARFVNESSPPPVQQGDGTWWYPNRQFNVIARCLDGQTPAFERIAKVELPGWTVRGLAGFSATGSAALATTLGLTQVVH